MGKIRNGEWIDFMIDTLGITIDPRIDEYIDARTYIKKAIDIFSLVGVPLSEDNFNYAIFNNCYYIFGY
jgi:hypothetical protein